ncbi:hypothetical protein ACOSOMT5_P3129 [Acidiphilium sp. MT5]
MVTGPRLHHELGVAATIDNSRLLTDGPTRRAPRSHRAGVAPAAGLRCCGVSAERFGQKFKFLHELKFNIDE